MWLSILILHLNHVPRSQSMDELAALIRGAPLGPASFATKGRSCFAAPSPDNHSALQKQERALAQQQQVSAFGWPVEHLSRNADMTTTLRVLRLALSCSHTVCRLAQANCLVVISTLSLLGYRSCTAKVLSYYREVCNGAAWCCSVTSASIEESIQRNLHYYYRASYVSYSIQVHSSNFKQVS
jgi:hypothetical protein